MTWKRMMGMMAVLMLLPLLAVFFVVSRQDIPGSEIEIMGVRSVFPAGGAAAVVEARNGWQGLAFAGNFRFFRRPAADAGEDFAGLKRGLLGDATYAADLDLFAGGLYVVKKAGKGYRLACIFYEDNMNYWADMVSRSSLHFSCRSFERFILGLEIGGKRVSPQVAGQIGALQGRISPLFMQTPGMLLGMMAAAFVLVILIVYLANRYSGSCPRRNDLAREECTPYATLRVGGFGRRQITACCLCREGEFLVIYRWRRPYMKIDIHREGWEIAWEKTSFRYRNIRVTLAYEDFEKWRLRLLA